MTEKTCYDCKWLDIPDGEEKCYHPDFPAIVVTDVPGCPGFRPINPDEFLSPEEMINETLRRR